MVMVFNATYNNISAISWRSVLLVEETGVPGENHWAATNHKFTTQCCIEYTTPWTGFELTTLVVICTYCTGSYKSNYLMITITTVPLKYRRRIENKVCYVCWQYLATFKNLYTPNKQIPPFKKGFYIKIIFWEITFIREVPIFEVFVGRLIHEIKNPTNNEMLTIEINFLQNHTQTVPHL